MERPDNISLNTFPIHWKKSDPAPEMEMKSFWKELRHFYRTGEKSETSQKTLSSALLSFLDESASAYPFTLGDNSNDIIIESGEKAPFYMLDFLLSQLHQENRKAFKEQLAELIKGLNQLLKIDDKSTEIEALKGDYEFANELIAFDKMVDMIPQATAEKLSEIRSARLSSVIATLQEGLELFTKQEGIVVLESGIDKNIDKASFFNNALVIEGEDEVFERSQKLFQREVKDFTSLMKAYRIAKLEIQGAYNEEIHNDYFEHFSWYRLLPEELKLFYPVLVIVNQSYVLDHLSSFSGLLASNKPIKVVVLNHEHISSPNQEIRWEDASHQFRQEIAAIAMASRNVFTFQTSMADPSTLYQRLTDCFKSTAPGLCNLSVPSDDTTTAKMNSTLMARAANASRYFPQIIYDPAKSRQWRARFDINGNIQSTKNWPAFTLKANTSDSIEIVIETVFTYADYKACFPEKVQELMLVPDAFSSEYLVSLSDYLEMDEANLYGKIPYIWLIDKENELHRAAVPNVWVVSCQERLDFWCFLQELGGLKSYHSNLTLQNKNKELSQLLEKQKAEMDNERQHITATAQEEAIAIAAERLISALLNDQDLKA